MSNLSDPKQVQDAKQREQIIREKELNDIKTVLGNASGKRLVWRLLEQCGAYRSVFDSDPSRMSYLSGKQDLGHFIMAEINAADKNLLGKLVKENTKGEHNAN